MDDTQTELDYGTRDATTTEALFSTEHSKDKLLQTAADITIVDEDLGTSEQDMPTRHSPVPAHDESNVAA